MNSPFSFLIAVSVVSLIACQNSSPAEKLTDDGEYQVAVDKAVSNVAEVGEVKSSCPADMQTITGMYCPEVSEPCLRFRGPPGSKPVVCEKFGEPKCLSKHKVPMAFCVDTFEWPNQKGVLPQVKMSWYDAKNACESVGKRLCSEPEINFACEGEEMMPYPYGNGRDRVSDACNQDRTPITPFIWGWNKDHTQMIQVGERPLSEVDQRMPSGSKPECRSKSGVFDIVANVDEWIFDKNGRKDHQPFFSVLHSGHYVKGARNRCRGTTTVHGPTFSFYITGTRCCKDIN
jgi:sulfatase modifying factor 1